LPTGSETTTFAHAVVDVTNDDANAPPVGGGG
jgi:hypothetical protein